MDFLLFSKTLKNEANFPYYLVRETLSGLVRFGELWGQWRSRWMSMTIAYKCAVRASEDRASGPEWYTDVLYNTIVVPNGAGVVPN